jgi:hypothetical protein
MQGPIKLKPEVLEPNDPELPLARGAIGRQPTPTRQELIKMKRTKEAGGLIDWTAEPGVPTRAKFK